METERAEPKSALPMVVRLLPWVAAGSLLPALLIFPVGRALFGTAWRREVPEGGRFWLWVGSLVALGFLMITVFGNVPELVQTLRGAEMAFELVWAQAFLLCLGIFLLLRATGLPRITNPWLPLGPLRPTRAWAWLLLTPLPLMNLLAPDGAEKLRQASPHPVMVALVTGWKAGEPVVQLTASFVLVVLGPVFEELLFRGVLARECQGPAARDRWLPATLLSLVFAALHWPMSPGLVFGFSIGLFGLRFLSGGVFLPLLFHSIWNLCLAAALTS
jgi:membrane protease YdiL (CAAX protease family)